MSGDGVSLPTALAQIGNAAKTQARGQQSTPQVTPFSEQKYNQEEVRIQRVKETTEAEKNKVTRQDEEKDKRKRRRLNRARKKALAAEKNSDDPQPDHGAGNGIDTSDGSGEKPLGSLIDLRV